MINKLNKWDLNCSVFNSYDFDDCMSLNELLCRFFTKINECIEASNKSLNLLEWLHEVGLKQEVVTLLGQWKDDGTLAELISEQILTEIKQNIENNRNAIEQLKTKDIEHDNEITSIKKVYENIGEIQNNVALNSDYGNYEKDYTSFYNYDKLRLLNGVYSYYDSLYYPNVNLDDNGKINFTGICKITSQPTINIERNMIELCKIYHFNINENIGVPMAGFVTGVSDDDFNDRTIIPCCLLTDGTLLIKNIGYPNKYFNRIELFNLSLNTSAFGKNVIRTNTNNAINRAIEKSRFSSGRLLFFTDLHLNIFSNNKFNMIREIIEVQRQLNPISILDGGDNIIEPYTVNPSVNIDIALNAHREVLSNYGHNKLVFANGNHDNNATQNYPNNANNVIYPQMIKKFFNNNNFVFGGEDKYYGYIDYPNEKIRIVSIDVYENDFISPIGSPTRCSEEQLLWHCQNSFKMGVEKSDWLTIILSHNAPIDREGEGILSNSQQIRSMIECYNQGIDFQILSETIKFSSQGRREVPVWLYGHIHQDTIQKINGINYVSTVQGWAVDTHGLKRYIGTEKECAFDIITMDKFNRKFYFTRVGAGNDREITY